MHLTSLITSLNSRPAQKPYQLLPKKLKTKSQHPREAPKEVTPASSNDPHHLPGLTPPKSRANAEGFPGSGTRVKLPEQPEPFASSKKPKLSASTGVRVVTQNQLLERQRAVKLSQPTGPSEPLDHPMRP